MTGHLPTGPIGDTAVPCAINTADGHVVMMGEPGANPNQVRLMVRAVTLAGVQGYRFGWIDHDDAHTRLAACLRCEACDLAFPCGCSVTIVTQAACPHGTLGRLHEIAAKLGMRQPGGAQ